MAEYDYYDEMKDDILTVLGDGLSKAEELIECIEDDDREGLAQLLTDRLYSSRVTGFVDGSYFFNRYRAAEAIIDNIDLLDEVIEECMFTADELAEHMTDYEWQDIQIRCYILGQVVDELIEDDWDEIVKLIYRMR